MALSVCELSLNDLQLFLFSSDFDQAWYICLLGHATLDICLM